MKVLVNSQKTGMERTDHPKVTRGHCSFSSLVFQKTRMITLTTNNQTSLSRIVLSRSLLDQRMTTFKQMYQLPSPTVALAFFH